MARIGRQRERGGPDQCPREIRQSALTLSKEQKCLVSMVVGTIFGVPLLAGIAVIYGAFLYPTHPSWLMELDDAGQEFYQILAWPMVTPTIWALKSFAPLVWIVGPVCGFVTGALFALWIWQKPEGAGPATKLPHYTTERLEEWLDKVGERKGTADAL